MADPIVRYSGQISEWTSPKYTTQQLAKFIETWRAVIEVDASELVKFIFNVTASHTIIEEFGSGDGMGGTAVVNDNDQFGSGDITTIEDSIPGGEDEEQSKGVANIGELDGISGGLRVQTIGYITAICTALAAMLSFV